MSRWTVGNVTVVREVDVAVELPADRPVPAWCVPAFARSAGDVGTAFSAFAIESGDRRIVVDPWLVNDRPRALPDASEQAARCLGLLEAAGFPAGEVDVVVNSHLDGIGWNTRPGTDPGEWVPSFPNARYRWTAAQLERHRDDDRLRPLMAAGMIDPVEPGEEIAPDVAVVDASGHEPGHVAVRIDSGGERALIAGHLFVSPLQVADPTIAFDEDVAAGTRHRVAVLTDLAARHGLLLAPLLGGPGGGIVVEDGQGWRLEP